MKTKRLSKKLDYLWIGPFKVAETKRLVISKLLLVTAATPQPKYNKGDEDQWERSVSSDYAYYNNLLDYDYGSDTEYNIDI